MEQARSKVKYSTRDTMTAVTNAASQLGKFNGQTGGAPKWINGFCQQAYRHNFEVAACLDVLRQCFVNETLAWLEAKQLSGAGGSMLPIEALVLAFKEQYMGETVVAELRHRLLNTRLTGQRVTEAELRAHYKAIVDIVNSLRLCDPTLSEEQFHFDFHDSLPHSLKTFMGVSWKTETTLDGIYQMARKGINKDAEKA